MASYKLQRRYFRHRRLWLMIFYFGYKLQRRYFRQVIPIPRLGSQSVINSNGDTSDHTLSYTLLIVYCYKLQRRYFRPRLRRLSLRLINVINSNGDTSDKILSGKCDLALAVINSNGDTSDLLIAALPAGHDCYKLQRRYFRLSLHHLHLLFYWL